MRDLSHFALISSMQIGIFKPPHWMMRGAYSVRLSVRAYMDTCVPLYVRLYECVYVHTYMILLDSG